jgi:hypothetical protein
VSISLVSPASGGSSAAGGGGEPQDRRAVYISFAYRTGVGRLEVFLPLAMVMLETIYLILVFGVGVVRFTELGDFVEVTFCFFIDVFFGDGLAVPVVLIAHCADEEMVSARNWVGVGTELGWCRRGTGLVFCACLRRRRSSPWSVLRQVASEFSITLGHFSWL